MSQGKTIISSTLSVLMGLILTSCSTFKSLELFSSENKTPASTGHSKISGQNPENYTIQIATGSDVTHIQQKLSGAPINCELFQFQLKHGKTEQLPVITCGSFSSLQEANSVMLSLPMDLNTSTSGIYQWKALQPRAVND